jgi:hypothetical protein
MPVIAVPGAQVPARDKAAGAHAELEIERMPHEPILYEEALEGTALRPSVLGGSASFDWTG